MSIFLLSYCYWRSIHDIIPVSNSHQHGIHAQHFVPQSGFSWFSTYGLHQIDAFCEQNFHHHPQTGICISVRNVQTWQHWKKHWSSYPDSQYSTLSWCVSAEGTKAREDPTIKSSRQSSEHNDPFNWSWNFSTLDKNKKSGKPEGSCWRWLNLTVHDQPWAIDGPMGSRQR